MRYLRLGTVLALVVMLLITAWTVVMDLRKDKTPPVIHDPREELHISVKDDPSVMLAELTATDDRDGDLTDKILIERISRFGENAQVDVSFVVFDSANNMCRHHRTVYYDDYTAPRFTLTMPLMYNEGEVVGVMDRLKLHDDLEGDITYKVKLEDSNVNDSQPGVYEVTLRAVTDHGMDVCVRVPLNVKKYDALAPRITLSEYLVYIKKGQKLKPQDYITDVVDCNGYPIDLKMVFVYSQVDTNKVGGGQVRFETVDGVGRKGYTYLTVIVEE